jgi:PAS domain-containing protein
MIAGLREQFGAILDESPQAMFIYLDDYHKVCNRRFADMLGYSSPDEWARMPNPVSDTTTDTRDDLKTAVMAAIQDKAASTFPVSWKTKYGRTISTKCVAAPGMYHGQPYVMLFFEA